MSEDERKKHGGREPVLDPGTEKYFAKIEDEWFLGMVDYTRKEGKHLFRRDVVYVASYRTAHGRVWVSPYDLVKELPKGAKEGAKNPKKDLGKEYRYGGSIWATQPSYASAAGSEGKKRPREGPGSAAQYPHWYAETQAKIKQVQEFTNWEGDLCRDILQQSHWVVESAINQILSSGMICGGIDPVLPLPPIEAPPAMKKTLSLVDDTGKLEDVNLEDDGSLGLSDFLFRLPDMSRYSEMQAQSILASITDAAVQNDLQKQTIINKNERETHFFPLKTENDGNCLLHSISVSLFGQHDRKLALRSFLRNVFRDGGCEFSEALKDRWGVCQMEDREVSERQLDVGFTELRKQASLSKVQDAWGRMKHAFLESTHVLFMAHIIRRPILIYAAGPEDNEGNVYPATEICGLYLPFEIAAYECYRSPLILAFAGSHFTPLVCIESQSNPMRLIIGDRMPLQFLKNSEDRRQLIEDYMDNLTNNDIDVDSDTEELFASLNFGSYPDIVQDLLSQWLDRVASLHGAHPAEPKQSHETYVLGEIVEARNSFMEPWQTGQVKSLNPVRVEIFGLDGEKVFIDVRQTNLGSGTGAHDEAEGNISQEKPISIFHESGAPGLP